MALSELLQYDIEQQPHLSNPIYLPEDNGPVSFKLDTQNYPQLQNLIRRDPQSYVEEFNAQFQHFQSLLSLLTLSPDDSDCKEEFVTLISFISHVSYCYPHHTSMFPAQLVQLLKTNAYMMHPHVRKSIVQALILLRHRKQIYTIDGALELYMLFFDLFACHDKPLRALMYPFLLHDIKTTSNSAQLARTLLPLLVQQWVRVSGKKCTRADSQGLASTAMPHTASTTPAGTATADLSLDNSAKMALMLVMDMYRSGSWKDGKIVHVLSMACLVENVKIALPALHFFCGGYHASSAHPFSSMYQNDPSSDSDSDEENGDDATVRRTKKTMYMKQQATEQIRKLEHSMRVSGNTKAQKKKMTRLKKHIRAPDIMDSQEPKDEAAASFRNSPLEILYDPQDFLERLFGRLQTSRDAFTVKTLMIRLCSELITYHSLPFGPFYSYAVRYIKPTLKDCTRILAYATQSIIPNITPEHSVHELVNALMHHFIAEYCRPEVITVGLNALREICTRHANALTSEQLEYLVTLKKFKNKGVFMAARSLLTLYRAKAPELLPIKERGRFKRAKTDSVADVGDSEDEKSEDADDTMDENESEGEDETVDWVKIMTERILTPKEVEAIQEKREENIGMGVDQSSIKHSIRRDYKITPAELKEHIVKSKASYEDRMKSVKEGRPDRSVYKKIHAKINPYASSSNASKERSKNVSMRKHRKRNSSKAQGGKKKGSRQ